MTTTVKGAGRRKYARAQAKHSQRTPLPPKGSKSVQEEHTKSLEEAVAPAAPLSKAAAFALDAEKAGWTVERVREGELRTVIATRGDEERLTCRWNGNAVLPPFATYEVNDRTRTLPNAASARRVLAVPRATALAAAAPKAGKAIKRAAKAAVAFDVGMSDEEVLSTLRGREITWESSLAGGAPVITTAVVPGNGTKTRLVEDDLDEPGSRQLTFCDAAGGGYRTVRLSKITGVGAALDADGHLLTQTRHRALMATKEGKKK